MQSSRRSHRVKTPTSQTHWSVPVIGGLLVLISALMCYLIVTTVGQSVKLSSIQSALTKMEQPSSSKESEGSQTVASQSPEKQNTESSAPLTNQENQKTTSAQQFNEPVKSLETNTGVYVVKAGDTLSSIADQLGTSIDALMSENGLSSNVLQIGQELTH